LAKASRATTKEVVDVDAVDSPTHPKQVVARSPPNPVQKFATAGAFVVAISAGTAAGLSSPNSDRFIVSSLTQALGGMTLTQVLSPGSEWMSSFFEEDEHEDVPEMPVAEMPVLWDRQEWQDDSGDEEVQPPVGPGEQGDPDTPPL
jgi:hypothetical protein